MALDALRAALPPHAKDLSLGLGSLTNHTELTEQQLWGTLLACAEASRSGPLLREVEPEARKALSEDAYRAARTAAALMAMTNVFYRTRHLLADPEYDALPAGLRMNALRSPGVARTDFELWSLAVSAVGGCGRCLQSHERALREGGMRREVIQEAIRVAAVLTAVASTLDAEIALHGVTA
ncbi:carboxymuconolactone decarboxylase family protein [Streptomyces sp. DSM 44915]|uniref:Alkyl hydroperoxide reductase AhpD n=1 Tax=Streptomyces chisholmiae TaxID=3075540 RepID=A0ABU2JK94_9ACTN|nr:carboxymuconolactone decarboxylase family protein [Streptomyces sp. DSM 44915]MDT0265406.1 carboxymuconolactone decarboxylase family protein [Streptomyces sp. DSM 44915]